MDTQNNQRRIFFARVIGSIAIFTIFVITAVSWVLTQDETLKWALFLPLIAAVAVLPRHVTDESLTEERRSRLKLWLSSVRLAYFAVALAVMLGLPEILY